MCRKARKPVRPTVFASEIEPKQRPFVNILDFVDTYRTGQEVPTFEDFLEFKQYTNDGRRVDLKSARENDFLAPLLQKLRKGPYTSDEPHHMQRKKPQSASTAFRHLPRENLLHTPKQAPSSPSAFSRELSPSLQDANWLSSRSPSPNESLASFDADFNGINAASPRSSTPERSRSSSMPDAFPSSSPTDFSEAAMPEDREFDDPDFNDAEFQHVLLTQEENMSSMMNEDPDYGKGTPSLGRSVLGALSEAAVNKKRSASVQEFDDPEFDDPDFQHVLLTQEENLISASQNKKTSHSPPRVVVKKRRLDALPDHTSPHPQLS